MYKAFTRAVLAFCCEILFILMEISLHGSPATPRDKGKLRYRYDRAREIEPTRRTAIWTP